MTSRRVLKVASAIREVVGMAILAELKDPRIQNATITYVEVSADLRHAKVHVSVMGSPAQQNLCIQGLQSSAGFLQRKINKRIDARYTPRLQFLLDMGVKRSIEVSQILHDVLPTEEEGSGTATGTDSGETEADSSVADAPAGTADGAAAGDASVGSSRAAQKRGEATESVEKDSPAGDQAGISTR